MTNKIYYERIEDAIERNRPGISITKKKLEEAGVKYVLSSWIDLHGIPKTKPDNEPIMIPEISRIILRA